MTETDLESTPENSPACFSTNCDQQTGGKHEKELREMPELVSRTMFQGRGVRSGTPGGNVLDDASHKGLRSKTNTATSASINVKRYHRRRDEASTSSEGVGNYSCVEPCPDCALHLHPLCTYAVTLKYQWPKGVEAAFLATQKLSGEWPSSVVESKKLLLGYIFFF